LVITQYFQQLHQLAVVTAHIRLTVELVVLAVVQQETELSQAAQFHLQLKVLQVAMELLAVQAIDLLVAVAVLQQSEQTA
jgi:hypothetical protein